MEALSPLPITLRILHNKYAKYSPCIPLYPTTAIIGHSQPYTTPIPKTQIMQYFKSIYHVCTVWVFVSHCNIYKPVPTPQYTSKSMELQTFPAQYKFQVLPTDRKQNVRSHHTQHRQAEYSIGNSSKSLVSRMQNKYQVPTTIYDRNVGHYVPTVLLHRPQNSPPQFQNTPPVGSSSNVIYAAEFSDKEIKSTRM